MHEWSRLLIFHATPENYLSISDSRKSEGVSEQILSGKLERNFFKKENFFGNVEFFMRFPFIVFPCTFL